MEAFPTHSRGSNLWPSCVPPSSGAEVCTQQSHSSLFPVGSHGDPHGAEPAFSLESFRVWVWVEPLWLLQLENGFLGAGVVVQTLKDLPCMQLT